MTTTSSLTHSTSTIAIESPKYTSGRIPKFPEFKKIEEPDKNEVEQITSRFPPYSDYSFSNLRAWDVNNEMAYSILNCNLVVKFTDYVNCQPFISFIGDSMVNETARLLIDYSEKTYKTAVLKLIPEAVVGGLDIAEYDIIPDADSRDYVYSIHSLSNLNNWTRHSSSRGIKKFIKSHPDYVVKVCALEEIVKGQYVDMFKTWAEAKHINNHAEFNEYRAFKRFLELKNDKVKVVSLCKNGALIGFTVYEICSELYAVSHFIKTDKRFHVNINDLLNWEEAKVLSSHKIHYFNWQQDLGIPGLRKSKEKYRPEYFLNKYSVKKRG